MSDRARPRRRSRSRPRGLVLFVTLTMLAALVVAGTSSVASAAGTVLFQNSFMDPTVDGTGTVTVPTPVSGPNVGCLTATGNTTVGPLLSCTDTTDASGSGKLRLTPAVTNKVGAVFGQGSFPTSNGLDVTFNSYQWGGGSADGIAFMLAAVDPANPVPPTSVGSSGGALGYSAAPGLSGLVNAYLGVGLDVFGNYSNSSYSGTGCAGNIPNFGVATPGAVAVRGPGSIRVGYCGLTTTWDGTAGSKVALHATTRAASAVPVEVLINPTSSSFTADSGVSVASGTYKVVVTPIGQATRTLTGTLPVVTAGLYPSSSWLNANGVPKQLAFGFVGSTGSVTDNHEISNTKVLTFNPVPQLAVTTVSSAAATSTPGLPVTYRTTANVMSGADETSPISVTQTTPTGVVPVGAYGTGWTCATPVGQTVTCTTTASSFPNGTTLPVITVVAIVTGASVTSTTIQNGSPARASSADANPATSSVTTLGTLPTTPGSVTVTPAIGSIAGGAPVTVGGTNIVAATAIEIGTTTEQQAATPVTLLPCPGAAAAGCFTVSGSTLVISSMPARPAAATVSVTVVTSGVAGAASYVYADKPAAPAAPTATAGLTSATVSWVAPASNGSPLTSYVVTPYLAGVAQTPISYDTSTTTRTLTGLTANGSYAFTVAAVNAFGTSVASAKSATVTPYALPGAPVITAVSAGDNGATLTWSAPASNGSAISGYVVTPYLGAVAQTPQTFASIATTQTVTGLTPGSAYTFTVAAQNLAGTGPSSPHSSTVTPNVSPSLTIAAPPAGEVGVTYNLPLAVANGTAPFTWSISTGALPPGLTLNPTSGLISGTPTTAGTTAFTVQVLDASGQVASQATSITMAAAPSLAFTPAPGEVGVAYSQPPVLTGGTAPFAWTIAAGSLPAGLSLSASTGLVSGTPTAAGTFSATVSVTDGFGQVASRTVTVIVVARPALVAFTPPLGQVGVAYATTFSVTGGTLPLTWSTTAGTLPPGLTLSPTTGVLSGTPTTVGTSSFTVLVVDANGQTTSSATSVVIAAGPLVIIKTANVSSTVAGATVAYTISITNRGSTTWTGAALSDPLTGVVDDAVYNANATATAGTLSFAGSTLGWTGNIGANGSVTITYSVTVRNPDLGDKILANTVISSTLGANCASGTVDSRCSATVNVAGLTIVKTADVATTTPGSVVHFRIVVTNTGPVAYPAASLTDSLGAVLDDATYNGDGTATVGTVTYASPSLSWSGDLAVGGSATITYSVTVADPDTGNQSLTGTVVSASPGNPCPSGAPAPQCTATVTVLIPALTITDTANVTTTVPGAVVTSNLVVANTGQTPSIGTTVTLALAGALDDATYNGDATASAGSVVFSAGSRSLVWTGNLAVGATVTVTASVSVLDPDPGDLSLATIASSTAAGSTCPPGSSNPACSTSVAVRIPQLTIVRTTDVATTTPGSVVHDTVTVTNTGQTAYIGASFSDPLSGVLDDAAYNGDAAATSGTASFAASTVTWSGNLAIGATTTVTYSVRVHAPDTGDLTLSDRVTSSTQGSNCPAAGTDPRCSSSVTVLVPGLTITSSVGAPTATPGDVVRYSVTVVNTGQTTYTGMAVTLDLTGALDDATYDNDAAITTGSLVTNPDGTVDWVFNLAPGATATGTIGMTVNTPAVGDRSLLITAVSSAVGSPCQPGSPAPACNATVTILVPGLTITKTADTAAITPGGTVHYTILLTNTGQTAYLAATLSDDLSAVLTDAAYGADATATSGTLAYGAPTLTWTGALAIGASTTITYSVTVRDPDPGDKHLVNTVVSSSSGSNCPTGGADPRCVATVAVLVPALTIAATSNVATTTPGAVVHESVAITNSGATPYVGTTVTDSLAGVVDDATYDADAAASAGSVGFAGSTLTWTGDLAVGATVTVTYSVTVHTADGGDNLVTSAATSSARGNNCAVGNTDSRCAVTVPVARLVLSLSAAQLTTTPGSVVHFISTYTNTGQVPYVGISVDSLAPGAADDGLPGGDQTASSGSLTLGTTGITWTGSIPVGGAVDLAATMTVRDPDTGDGIIVATAQSAAPGNNCAVGSTDPRCTVLITVLFPGLTITKSATTTATGPGGSVGYTISIHDSGQTPYTAASISDSMAGVLDDATYDGDATADAGTVTFSSPNLSWTGDLTVGQTATITYTVTVHSPLDGDKTMVNAVTSSAVGSSCPASSGNPACRSTVVVLTPALTIRKTSDVANATLGSTVTYTVAVTDSGQTSYGSAAFSDDLANVLDDATYNADASASGGTVSYTGGVLSWSGGLTPGTSATITYTVTINNPASGDRSMSNTVVSTNTGSNCASGSADTRCTAVVAITNAVSLTFTQSADVAATVAAGVVTYTVTAVNSSASDVASASFTDALSGILDDATYNGDGSADLGAVSYTSPNLTWSGTIAAGTTVTLRFSVTVDSVASGDDLLAATVSSASLPASDNCATGSADPRCTTTVTVASLVIEQHYAESSTTPGSTIHLSATFTNTGQTPYVGIAVTSPSADTVDDALPSGDQTASSGSLVLSASAITWTGNIPIGGVVTVSGTLTVTSPDTGNRRVAGTLVSSAPGNNCPAGGTDARCTAAVSVLLPGLTITKTADTPFVTPGGTVDYTITVANTGQTSYTGATVADSLVGVLDDATFGGSASASLGAVSYAASTLTWTGDLALGQTAIVTYSVTVHSPDDGDKTMVNSVSSTAVGNTCPPASGNPDCRSTLAVLTPALAVASSASVATSAPGGHVTFTVTIDNTGQIPFAAAEVSVALRDVLDDATYNGDAASSIGSVGLVGQTLTWTGPSNPGDASVTVTYSVTVDTPVTGNFSLDQTAVSTTPGTTCPAAGTDPRCTTSVPIAGLAIANRADATTTQPTDVVRNTVTFTNTGQVPYLGISIMDGLAGALDDATYNGDAVTSAGSLALDPATGRVTWSGDLAVGQTVTATGSFTVDNPDPGDRAMTTVVSTTTEGSNCPTGGSDPSCRTDVTVLIPALSVATHADRLTAAPGAVVSYTITVANTGQTDYTDATVTDLLTGVLNDATYGGDASASRGSVSFATPSLTWVGDLALGQTAVITFTAVVNDPDLGDHLMIDQVSSDAVGSTCPTDGSGPACLGVVVVLVPVVELALTADRTTTVPGATVSYTVNVVNAGQTDEVGIQISLALGGALDDAVYGGDGTATMGNVSFASPTLSWVGDLSIGASATITYTLTVRNPDPGDRLLTSTLASTTAGSTCGSPSACTNQVTVLIPGLAVTTQADVATASPGDHVGFTVTITNTGQTDYGTTLVSTDLSGALDDASLDSPIVATAGVATYAAPILAWTGSLAIGATVTVTFPMTVQTPDPGDELMTVSAQSLTSGSTCPGSGDHPACTTTVAVTVPGLTLTKSASASTTTPGGVIGYTITVVNTGQTTYHDAVVDDALDGVLTDAAYDDNAQVTGGGTLSLAGSTLTWIGDLAVAARVTITYSVTVHDPDTGDKEMTNVVSSDAPGSTCPVGGSHPACEADVRVLVPALLITKTADTATAVAGGVVHYTVTVTDTGQTDFAAAAVTDSLSAVLDHATYAGGATATSGTVTYTAPTLAWTGALAVGATATITYSVTTDFPATGDPSLANSVRSSSPGATCVSGDEAGCHVLVDVLVPALAITKAVDVDLAVAGGTVQYTISATNVGEADYPSATLTDALAGVLDDATYDADAVANLGSLDYGGGTLSWNGALAVGATVVITYSVTVDVVDTGDAVLTNQVVSTSMGSSCLTGGSDPSCATSTPVAARSITLSGLPASFTLAGLPHTTVSSNGAVTMTITTNDPGGYLVEIQAVDGSLIAADPGNHATIAIDQLGVRESGTSLFQALSADIAQVVHRQDTASGPGGDAVSNDFQVHVPFVPPDTYSGSLDYVVSAQ